MEAIEKRIEKLAGVAEFEKPTAQKLIGVIIGEIAFLRGLQLDIKKLKEQFYQKGYDEGRLNLPWNHW